MTYNVFGGTLNLAQSIRLQLCVYQLGSALWRTVSRCRHTLQSCSLLACYYYYYYFHFYDPSARSRIITVYDNFQTLAPILSSTQRTAEGDSGDWFD